MKLTILVNDEEILALDRESWKKREEGYQVEGKYSGLDVAWYVVDYVKQIEEEITNLQLQKIIYYIQETFVKKKGVPLFYTPIEAWKLGPVVREVYNYYKGFANHSISDTGTPLENFTEDETDGMNEVVKRLINIDKWDLVDRTHGVGRKDGVETPWQRTYQNGLGKSEVIEISTIMEFIKEEQRVKKGT